MILKKTCWLLSIYPSRVGAMIGTRDRVDLDAFLRFGFFLGAAFQIQDDLLNLVGDDRYGKEIGGDIWEGKRTLMLIRLLNVSSEQERRRITTMLGQPREERLPEEIAWVRDMMDEYECIDYARHIAYGLAGSAQHEFAQLYGPLPDSRDRRFIEQLVTWMLHRQL